MMSRLALDWDQRKGWAVRWKMILYRNNLLELPEKLAVLGQRIDYRLLPDATPEKVQVLVTNLQSLAYRINELMEARESPQSESLVNQYHDDLRAWRMVIQKHCRLWAQDPATATARGIELEKRLAAWLARLEARIDETYRQVTEDELNERDYENFFRYLGSLRNLSEAAIDYAQLAEGVNWTQWQEARF